MEIASIIVLVLFILYTTGVWRLITGKIVGNSSLSETAMKPLMSDLLSARMSYYTMLETQERTKFIQRTFQIVSSLDFVSSEEGFIVTDEMRILVSASVAQLTFGWTEVMPPSLNRIELFSDSVYSDRIQARVKGLTLPGRVMLSWRYFQEGYRLNNDKINLGLHELAHAVWDERYTDSKVLQSLSEWESVASIEFAKMKRHTDSGFFRDYAATNLQELWACSIECFFEAPEEFQEKLPDLYRSIAEMLNQNMITRVRKEGTRPLSV